MTTVSFIRLRMYDDGVETELPVGIVGVNPTNSSPTEVIERFDDLRDYPAGSLVVRKGKVYYNKERWSSGVWMSTAWTYVNDQFAVVTRHNQSQNYGPDSIIVHPRKDEVYFTSVGQAPGDFDDSKWVPITDIAKVETAVSYLDQTTETERTTTISGKAILIHDYATEADSFLEDFEAFYSCIDPTKMARNPDGTGEPIVGQRIFWLEDITGNGNHAIVTEEDDAPFYMETSQGVGYLWFRLEQHMKIPSLKGELSYYVAHGGRGISYHHETTSEFDEGSPRLGIVNKADGKDWRLAGFGITSKQLRPDQEEKAITRLQAYVNNVPSNHLNPLEAMFENETRLLKIFPGFNYSAASFNRLFKNCAILKEGMAEWLPSFVTGFEETFYGCKNYAEDLSQWNVSSGMNFKGMFNGCHTMDFDFSNWNTSNAFTMEAMFKNCPRFNNGGVPLLQEINAWNMNGVLNTISMFENCTTFNQPIHNWRVSNVVYMDSMFAGASSFNMNISGWNIRSVVSANNFLHGAISFDQDLSRMCADGLIEAPIDFLTETLIEEEGAKHPKWGGCNPSSLIAVFDYTNPGTMADFENQTGAIRDGDTVHFIRDLSGNENHATQTDPLLAPVYRELSPGEGYLEFKENSFMKIGDITDNTHNLIGFASQGAAEFRNVTNQYGINIGIKKQHVEKVWELTGEVVFKTDVSQTEWDERAAYVDANAKEVVLEEFKLSNKFNSDVNLTKFVNGWNIGNTSNLSNFLFGCTAFNDASVVDWDLSLVEDASGLFSACSMFNQDISGWDVSNIKDLSFLLRGCVSFTYSLADWNFASAINIDSMLSGCKLYNHPVSAWDTSRIQIFTNLFNGCEIFDQNVNTLDFSSAIEAWGLFRNCTAFDNAGVPIALDLRALTNVSRMFQNASSFNQILDNCRFDSAQNLDGMFEGASTFNRPVNVFPAELASTAAMFKDAVLFDQNVNSLRTQNVENMKQMFMGAHAFANGNVNFELNVSSVTDFTEMFANCPDFNLSLTDMDFGAGQDFSYMFYNCSNFNQPLSTIRIRGTEILNGMFEGCTRFNQDLSHWDTTEVDFMSYMFKNCTSFTGTGLAGWTINGFPVTLVEMLAGTTSLIEDLSNWSMVFVNQERILQGSGLLAYQDRLPFQYDPNYEFTL